MAPYDGELCFEPGEGGRLLHRHPGGNSFEVGRVRVWEPAARLVFSWRLPNFQPDEVTQVEVQFAATPGGTSVSVTHRGFDALPPQHPARHGKQGTEYSMFIGRWWLDVLSGAKRHLAPSAPPA